MVVGWSALFAAAWLAGPVFFPRASSPSAGRLYGAPGERRSDKAESAFWRERGEGRDRSGVPAPLGAIVPGPGPGQLPFLPFPGGYTKEGPMTLADLGLVPDGQGGYRGQRPGYRITIDGDGTIH